MKVNIWQLLLSKTLVTALVLMAITIVSCYINVAESQEYVTDGLIGFWTMDGEDIQGNTVKDVSGENNHGEIGGNPEIVQGTIEEALHFDGEDDFVAIPDLGNEVAVSVDLWAIADQPFPDIRGLLSTYGTPQWKAGSVHFKFENGQIDILKNGGGRIQVPAVPDKWYHVGYTCDTEENELKLYVDGELIDTVVAGAEPNNLTSLRIGSEHEGRFFPGILDEVRLYNRALTEEEMKQNFAAKSNALAIHAAGKLAVTWGEIKVGLPGLIVANGRKPTLRGLNPDSDRTSGPFFSSGDFFSI